MKLPVSRAKGSHGEEIYSRGTNERRPGENSYEVIDEQTISAKVRWHGYAKKILSSPLLFAIGLAPIVPLQPSMAVTPPSPVQVTVNSSAYTVSFFYGSYNGNPSLFSSSSMPWWNDKSSTSAFLNAVGALGYPQQLNGIYNAAPLYAFNYFNMMGLYIMEAKTLQKRISDGYDYGEVDKGLNPSESLIYATAALTPLGITGSTTASSPSSTTFAGGTLVVDGAGPYGTSYDTGTGGSIDQQGNTSAFGGIFYGTGALNFVNTGSGGTISLTGSDTYTGATSVANGAKLSVNGSIASSSGVTVNSGGTIGGTGTLPTTTIQSGGRLAPGNSIGQITLGSLSFSGILDAEIQGPQNDKTAVTGSVTNFTGSANLIPFGGGNPWPNFDYQLITAANTFASSSSLTLTPIGITSALLLQGTTLVQEADGNGQTFDVMWRPNNGSGATASAMAALGQGNRNQLAAAGVFDSAFRRLASAAGDASGAITGLNATGSAIGTTGFTTGQAAAAGLSPEFLSTTAQLLGISSNSQLTAAISTITPEPYAAFQSVGLETLQRQRQQLLASAGQCTSTGWVINGPTNKTAKAPKNPICLYGQAANANSSINGQDGLSSYNANLFSSFYGLEVKANPYWRFGAAYGYGTSNLNGLGITNAWVTATVNSGSLYGVYTPTTSSPWTFKGLLGYGNYALNGSRQVAVIGTGTPITGSTTANGLTAALTAEVAIPLSKPSAAVPVLLKPLIGLAYGNYQQAGFSESGGGPLNLNVDGNSASSLIGTIGLELTSAPIPLNKSKTISLVPKLALAYQVDALAGELGNSSLTASMPASGSGSFLTQGQNRGVNGFSIAAGADLALGQSTALYASVNYEAFSSGNQVGYGGGLRFKF